METTTCRRAVEVRRMTGLLTREETDRLEEVGLQLRRQAADLAAAEYRWLVLLEEFDRGGGWGLEGAKSCAGWLVWACGLNPGAARERVFMNREMSVLLRDCDVDVELEFTKRETFAYVCEAYSRIAALAESKSERLVLLDEHAKAVTLSDERVNREEYLDILGEAVATRSGWKRILERCAPRSQRSMS